MKREWRRTLSILLSFVLTVGLAGSGPGLSLVAQASESGSPSGAANAEETEITVAPETVTVKESAKAEEQDTVSYVIYDDNGNKEEDGSCSEYTVVDADTTTWSNGWYVVNSNVTISSRITVSGTANLILCDGAKLTASGGITTTGAALNIYAQSGESGALEAAGGENEAGIGGGNEGAGGSTAIYGGTVTATGGGGAAGIGGGSNGAGGSIKIYGGEVTAQGSGSAAGIGGGNGGSRGKIAIYGGKVNAAGGNGGAGIGGGNEGAADSVTIYDGEVTAQGSGGGAGIGGGNEESGGSVTIYGGTVTATGGGGAAGIGGGKAGGQTISHGTLIVAEELTVFGGDSAATAVVISKEEGDFARKPYMAVKLVISVTGVTLDKSDVSVAAGYTETLTATISPDDATDKTVKWTSGNESVATVEDGVITGVAEGTTKIAVTTTDGSKTAACEVTVVKAYDLWVGEEQVTELNAADVLGDKKVSFDPATNTLTLNNATITDTNTAGDGDTACICSSLDDFIITLNGDNRVGDSNDKAKYPIRVKSLTIQGDGTLDVAGSECAIYADGDLTISAGEVTATGAFGISAANIELKNNDTRLKATAIKGSGGCAVAATAEKAKIEIRDRLAIFRPENATIATSTVSGKPCLTVTDSKGNPAEQVIIEAVYDVTKEETTNGSFTVSSPKAAEGDEITVTATPDEGCITEKMIYTDSYGTAHDITSTGKFTMPASDVTVSVTFKKLVQSVTLSKSTSSIIVGDTQTLTATISPDGATDKTVKWSVGGTDADAVKLYSDEACTTEVGTDATETLTVYAKGESGGTATITVTTTDGSKTATCEVTVNYALWIGKTQVTKLNAADVYKDGTVKFDPETNTLTLNNATITDTRAINNDKTACIRSELDGITIVLNGDNHIGDTTNRANYAIYTQNSQSNMTIKGDGKLDVVGEIGAISTGGSLTISGGEVTAKSEYFIAVYTGGSLTISGGKVVAESTTNIAMQADGSVTISGGEVIANAPDNAIICRGAMTISGGEVTATTTYVFACLLSKEAMTISDAIVTSKSGDGNSLAVTDGDLTIDGAIVTLTSNNARCLEVCGKIVLKNSSERKYATRLEATKNSSDSNPSIVAVGGYDASEIRLEDDLGIATPKGGKVARVRLINGKKREECLIITDRDGLKADHVIIEEVYYSITKEESSEGSFTVSSEKAKPGDEISVTAFRDAHYYVEKMTYTADGKVTEFPFYEVEERAYPPVQGKFTMPASDVEVSVTFRKLWNPWVKNDKGWWYKLSDGSYPTSCFETIDGKTYYFDSSGYMQTGWQKIGGKWYYFAAGGAMQTGWQKISGKWYYFAAGGAMQTGWQKISNKWYYFYGNGEMAANKWVGYYYLTGNGSMATNTWIGKYYVGADGKWIPGYKSTN